MSKNHNQMISDLHNFAMEQINEILIELQDHTLDVGEIPRRFDDWREDHGSGLWWNVEHTNGEIQEEPEYIGQPLDSDWPWEKSDAQHLLWVPLPRLARGRP